jgi:hypothetical protein
LDPDFKALAAGDETAIGEKGGMFVYYMYLI